MVVGYYPLLTSIVNHQLPCSYYPQLGYYSLWLVNHLVGLILNHGHWTNDWAKNIIGRTNQLADFHHGSIPSWWLDCIYFNWAATDAHHHKFFIKRLRNWMIHNDLWWCIMIDNDEWWSIIMNNDKQTDGMNWHEWWSMLCWYISSGCWLLSSIINQLVKHVNHLGLVA